MFELAMEHLLGVVAKRQAVLGLLGRRPARLSQLDQAGGDVSAQSHRHT